ncbi:MAG: polysaccharide biosynthesis protein [bacterium]
MHEELERMVTGRRISFFSEDFQKHSREIRRKLENSRILVVGAAGSIGSAVVKLLVQFPLKTLVLIDINENNLVEVVRDLRSTERIIMPGDFQTLPIGIGSLEFSKYMKSSGELDYIFNFSALKHVRSEKDPYSLMRMIDTNVVFFNDLLCLLEHKKPKKIFSVSSDKAANPANLMGATKILMEEALLYHSSVLPFSTSRFANVAFSAGSLLEGFIQRFNKKQPLAAPVDIKRYFISHEEASHLCLMASVLGDNRDIYFPLFTSGSDEIYFSDIAKIFLKNKKYESFTAESEEQAKAVLKELIPKGKWPCYFFKSDTTGEKAYEEFFTNGDQIDRNKYNKIGVIKNKRSDGFERFEEFLETIKDIKKRHTWAKDTIAQALKKAVPTLIHKETYKNLDQRM